VVGMSRPHSDDYLRVLARAFAIAAESGTLAQPVHVLAALAESAGPIREVLASGEGPVWPERRAPRRARGGSGGYRVGQLQQAATALARRRGEIAGPAHLLLALLDQGGPDVVSALDTAGLDRSSLRAAAVRILGAPSDLPPIPMPAFPPAGTVDRPALPLDELDRRAWAVLSWRQQHLPLHQLRRPTDYAALSALEAKAVHRLATRTGLDDDQRYSLAQHHRHLVHRAAAAARPDLVPPPPAAATMPVVTSLHGRRRRRPPRRLRFTVGWATWFGNRRVGIRNRVFAIRVARSYRGAPRI
jgi:hypothetical protein